VGHGSAGQEVTRPRRAAGSGDAAASRRAAGALEAEVLAVLQGAASALTPAKVREQLTGQLAYSTVVTILSRLHAKGVLTRVRTGRAYAYAPLADESGLAARRMRAVLESEGDREAVLARFVSGLTPADEQLLRRMLSEHPGMSG
jgi:predicted transcriptional regulator